MAWGALDHGVGSARPWRGGLPDLEWVPIGQPEPLRAASLITKTPMKNALDPKLVAEVAEILSAAESALFITGAGISADSGLPTYRGIGGLYEDAMTEEGMPIEVALSGAMFQERPELSWRHIQEIERACRGARHNRAHTILAELESRLPRACVLTQNVDGLHTDAGSRSVIEIHGSLRRLLCTQCSKLTEIANFERLPPLPTCDDCQGTLRPDVVLFGEMLPRVALERLQRELERGFDVVVSIGTTSTFPYIAEPVVMASRLGLPTIEINPGQTEVTPYVGYRLREGAAAALEAVAKVMGLSESG